MSILRFPTLYQPRPQCLVRDADLAKAEVVSAFVAEMLPKIEAVTGQIETRLMAMSDEDLEAIYRVLDSDQSIGGFGSIDEHVLMEVVSDEVARRCRIKGIPTPWERATEMDQLVAAELMIAANDEPDGAA